MTRKKDASESKFQKSRQLNKRDSQTGGPACKRPWGKKKRGVKLCWKKLLGVTQVQSRGGKNGREEEPETFVHNRRKKVFRGQGKKRGAWEIKKHCLGGPSDRGKAKGES